MAIQSRPDFRLRNSLLLLAGVFLVGVAGFMLIEEYTPFEAVYQTVQTLTTVGFGYVRPLSTWGMVHTMFLLLCGVGVLSYTALLAVEAVIGNQLRFLLRGDRMDQRLKQLRNHVIVCGYGRVGRMICAELQARGATFVAIERHPETPAEDGVLLLAGDATEDEVLMRANIDTASSLISALSNEAENVYVTLTARQLNPDIFITARADNETMAAKLQRAGANRVVCPYRTGAVRMAITTLQPNVVEFMDVVEGDQSTGLSIEEVRVGANSTLVGRSLEDIGFRKLYGLTVLGLKPHGQATVYNPPAQHTLEAGDILLVIGPREGLTRLAAETR